MLINFFLFISDLNVLKKCSETSDILKLDDNVANKCSETSDILEIDDTVVAPKKCCESSDILEIDDTQSTTSEHDFIR